MSSDPLHIHRLNDWIAGSKRRPKRKKLFGDFWLERELAILFADTGMGKSVLAVQIAESIARGAPIHPFQMTAKPQKVLYFDFELDDEQFEMRYSADPDNEGQSYLKKHYRFSNRFYRSEIEIEGEVPADFASFEEYLRSTIERGIRQNGARVVIIDNLTYIRGPHDTARHAIPLMRGLLRLKKELGLSILVLAHTPKRDTARRITVNDLQGSKVLSNFADNIFAIGQSNIDTGIRYVKHLKQRSGGMLYDASYVPAFELKKSDGNFLGFVFRAFGEEDQHLSSSIRGIKMERARLVRSMSERGMSQREIARELGISAATVNRYLHLARSLNRHEDEEAYNEDFYEHEDEDEEQDIDPEAAAEAERLEREENRRRLRESRFYTNQYLRSIGQPPVHDNIEDDEDKDDDDDGEDEPNKPNELNKLNELNELNKLPYKTLDDKIEVGDIVQDRDGRLMKKTAWGWDYCVDPPNKPDTS